MTKEEQEKNQIAIFKKLMTIAANNSGGLPEDKISENSISLCQDEKRFNQLVGISTANAKPHAYQNTCSGQTQDFIKNLNEDGINGKAWVNVGLIAMRAANQMITNPHRAFTPLKIAKALTKQADGQKLHLLINKEDIDYKKEYTNSMATHSVVTSYQMEG